LGQFSYAYANEIISLKNMQASWNLTLDSLLPIYGTFSQTDNAWERNVARCTKIIKVDPKATEAARAVNPLGAVQGQKGADEQDKYVINIKQIAKFVVGLGDRVASTDIEEGMRVGWSVLEIGLLRQILKKGCVLGEWMRKHNSSAIDTD